MRTLFGFAFIFSLHLVRTLHARLYIHNSKKPYDSSVGWSVWFVSRLVGCCTRTFWCSYMKSGRVEPIGIVCVSLMEFKKLKAEGTQRASKGHFYLVVKRGKEKKEKGKNMKACCVFIPVFWLVDCCVCVFVWRKSEREHHIQICNNNLLDVHFCKSISCHS